MFYNDNWEPVYQGNLPWENLNPDRNSLPRPWMGAKKFESSFYDADETLSYTEVDFFYESWYWYDEYRITFQSRQPSASTKVLQMELTGLLEDSVELAVLSIPRSYKGSWHANLLQYSNDAEVYNGYVHEVSCNYCDPSWGLATAKIFDGNTYRFKMGLYGEGVPAISFRPNAIRYSIVSGMRIYTGMYLPVHDFAFAVPVYLQRHFPAIQANNDAGSDPRRYLLQGRNKPGAKIKNVNTETCWHITANFTIASGDCSNEGDEYLFYTNRFGELRSPLYVGRCVDPTSYELGHMEFSTCHSYERGENHTKSRDNYFFFNGTVDGGIFSIESIKLDGWDNTTADDMCVEQSLAENAVNIQTCSGGDIQQFYVGSEGVFNVSNDEAWDEIGSGILPWVSVDSRNAIGQAISSTFAEADESLNFMEVKFYENTQSYYEYKVSFPELRSHDATHLHFAEIELPGKKLFKGIDGGAEVSGAKMSRIVAVDYEFR